MIEQEQLTELTESYLKSIISSTSSQLDADFDATTSFGELGIDSFYVLKIVRKLEEVFGRLPKTLLFEHFNIRDLATYFVNKHQPSLLSLFESSNISGKSVGEDSKPFSEVLNSNSVEFDNSLAVSDEKKCAPDSPTIILEKQVSSDSSLNETITNLFNTYKNETSVSRGTRNIAPYLFIGSEKKGYFNLSYSKNIVLVYAYTGAREYLDVLSRELLDYCKDNHFELNMFSEEPIINIGETSFSATPFGVVQRVLNLPEFSLKGGRMRRLRYQVSKFEKSGCCVTKEYKSGTDSAVDQNIADIIDQWCDARTMVNPLIQIVKDEILSGKLSNEHRLFLTSVDEVLQNVILISSMSSEENGYLMDLEFYPSTMPLGGLEYAIVNIINTLVSEGCTLLSLGGTYGCKLESSDNADPELDKILDELREQNIFNDEGNLQFKNKFRPENTSIYLCRSQDFSDPENVIDIIMMIADPGRIDITADSQHLPKPISKVLPDNSIQANNPALLKPSNWVIEGDIRSTLLCDNHFNPLLIPDDQIEFDLKTDSWAQLSMEFIDKQIRFLRSQIQQPVNLEKQLQQIFPFSHFLLTQSGREAENIFYQSWENKGRVLQNLLFPTAIAHQISNGFQPVEIPCSEIYNIKSDNIFKGELDLQILQNELLENNEKIVLACVELSDNAAGGYPVSMKHLKAIKASLEEFSIPLVMDVTRILENALFIINNEEGYSGKDIWQVVRELTGNADSIIVSLAKDFGVNKGGLVATNDQSLFNKMQKLVYKESNGLDVFDKKITAVSLKNKHQLEVRAKLRMEQVSLIWNRLKKANIPVVGPISTHCILIDVKQLGAFTQLSHSSASFIAWLYVNTGIRAGIHSVGMQKETSINQLVRLAIPTGLATEQVDNIIERLITAFSNIRNIPVLEGIEKENAGFGEINNEFMLKEYLNLSGKVIERSAVDDLPQESNYLESSIESGKQQQSFDKSSSSFDTDINSNPRFEKEANKKIAIVGMAGRYPKADNLEIMWDNLAQGLDCISEISEERLRKRRSFNSPFKYRAGFIDGIDKFDSLFFNISPREAETLDPQERIFLEVAWEALEDAGYYPECLQDDSIEKNVGVFVGAVWSMYQNIGAEERLLGNDAIASSFLWSVANRISYFMNLTGPSVTVDTACSASLTALYFAVEAIRKGECQSAIVGGVNLDVHQCKQEITVAGGLLSEDGLCHTFGKNANGYVPGEGIGALFLKPLEQAVEARDNIYAVVKSIAINHGGRASGYSVPNAKSQSRLILEALDKAQIDARTIGYIEAHGTGTELGDPIEISGLTNAFEKNNVKKQSCAIGSVKTNIGHLEAAAGIVGVCKVLLQMKHRKLVPSLHSSELNEFIEFENTPFYVQQITEEWKEKVVDGIQFPLRAGISSFGAGGSNAHVILEKYESPDNCQVDEQIEERIFPLSARNKEQLLQAAERLVTYLRKYQSEALSSLEQRLADIEFTLQVGRKSFDYRLAIVATSKDDLIEKLSLFINGTDDASILIGDVKKSDNITKLLSATEKSKFVSILSESRDNRKIAQLWTEGVLGDWQSRKNDNSIKRVSLPTYPFADKRHWLTESDFLKQVVLQTGKKIHPLIDSNESTFERQLFKKTFTEKEFFIYDHLVSDIPTLPGVGYLDFARKAGEVAAGRKVQKIKNILWVSPLTVQDSVPNDVLIELKPNGDTILFDVFSEHDNGHKQLYSQGKLCYASTEELNAEDEYIDIKAIRERCEKVTDGKDAYPVFDKLGLKLGPSFQVVQEVFKGDREVFGSLRIPEINNSNFHDFILHPSLVDGSFQVAMAAQLANSSGEMFVPYSLGEVEILHPLEEECFSYVREVHEPGSKVSKANVLIVNQSGKVLVKVWDSVGVPLLDVHEKPGQKQEGVVSTNGGNDQNDVFETLYYSTEWVDSPLEKSPTNAVTSDNLVIFDFDDHLYSHLASKLNSEHTNADNLYLVMPGDSFKQTGEQTYQINPSDKGDFAKLIDALADGKELKTKIIFAWSDINSDYSDVFLKQALKNGIYAFLYLCQSIIEKKLETKVQLIQFHADLIDNPQPHNDAFKGFVNILNAEAPRFQCKTLEISAKEKLSDSAADTLLFELEQFDKNSLAIRYQSEQRFARKIKEFSFDQTNSSEVESIGQIKQYGVYLITGGLGGLGIIFAEFLAANYQANLVLTGRSELTPEKKKLMEGLEQLGGKVIYQMADVSIEKDIDQCLKVARDKFGQINGVIHSAGVLRDSYVKNKTDVEMDAVFESKIFGTLHLDKLTSEDHLDFFVLFSSLAALAGNAGQSDYSYANHFMDSFSVRRNLMCEQGVRKGRTLSLNWSLWADGGMQLDEQTKQFFEKNLGIKALSIETGTETFVKGLEFNKSSFAVIEGVQNKIESAWGINEQEEVVSVSEHEPIKSSTDSDDEEPSELTDLVQTELSKIVMDFLKLDEDDIDLDSILLDLGFDSIGLTTFANAVNEKYGLDVTPVLFFEYPNIREIGKHIATEFKAEALKVHDSVSSTEQTVNSEAGQNSQVLPDDSYQIAKISKGGYQDLTLANDNKSQSVASYSPQRRFVEMPIAIVGMSGVMPQSDNLDEFWEKLKNSENNMITVIPEDRWNWQEYYGNPLKEENVSNSKWGGFMREVDKFDPLFFGISPKEAEMMDPQQRIFLETAWKAVEDSGQKVSELSGTRTGLFVGVATNDYTDLMNGEQVGLDGYTGSGNSHAVLANRVSFLLGLRGPSAPLDTACSSSLVAIHRALESIHTGSSDMAIVGGVQVMLSPAAYISFGIAGMLADDGKCKTFDKKADGYVRGEGSGAIFIKPLSMAEADGNNIYAVIKATAENHGGRVTFLTAPNPTAQAELLVEAYQKAEIDPSTVGYIECHGTGTSLGDPIEIQALAKSFSELYKQHNKTIPETPHCGLSSVKTNIGHLETAAGIAGILKVLLSIKNKQIPALLHYEELNPFINLKGSPFYMVDKTRHWEAVKSQDGSPLPRRAGVSSFGFGGANAHIILEEYITEENTSNDSNNEEQLIVLSAKNEERLIEYAQLMLEHLQQGNVLIADFAYTLQVGRDEMPERLAIVASDIDELILHFESFINNNLENKSIYRDTSTNKSKRYPEICEQYDSKASIKKLTQSDDLMSLAALWVCGKNIDWNLRGKSKNRKRLSLPTYPFARERYWFNRPDLSGTSHQGTQKNQITEYLNPLVQRNTSTLNTQKFSSVLNLNDGFTISYPENTLEIGHNSERGIWLWSAFVEMARVSGELSAERKVWFIRNVCWSKLCVFDKEAKDFDIQLKPGTYDVEFSIRTNSEQQTKIDYCDGVIAYSGQMLEQRDYDVEQLKDETNRKVLATEDAYISLKNSSGNSIAQSVRVIDEISIGKSSALSSFKLPEELLTQSHQSRVFSTILHAGLETGLIAFSNNKKIDDTLWAPVSVEELQMVGQLDQICYCYVSWQDNKLIAPENLPGMSLVFLDSKGIVVLRINNLQILPYKQVLPDISSSNISESGNNVVSYYQQVWKEQKVEHKQGPGLKKSNVLIFDYNESFRKFYDNKCSSLNGEKVTSILVKSGSDYQQLKNDIYQINPRSIEDYKKLFTSLAQSNRLPEEIVHLWSNNDFSNDYHKVEGSLTHGVFSLLYIYQSLINAIDSHVTDSSNSESLELAINKIRLLHVHHCFGENEQPQNKAMAAFVKTVNQESSKLLFKSIEVNTEDKSSEPNLAELYDLVNAELSERDFYFSEVQYQSGIRKVRTTSTLELSSSSQLNLREAGVYLISGGAGGLGLIFAKYLIEKVNATVILTGRSELAGESMKQVASLRESGGKVDYFAVDVSSKENTGELINTIKENHSRLDGILHAAGVICDSALNDKTTEEMERVFSAKIQGTINLDEASKNENLDFFCLFSSVSAITGNSGQCDYAYANSFMDHFAQLRNNLRQNNKRRGKSISFNWPLWNDGGMQLDPHAKKYMENAMGIKGLDTEKGIDCFVKALSSEFSPILVMQGERKKINKGLGVIDSDNHIEDKAKIISDVAPITKNSIENKQYLYDLLKKDLLKMVTETLRIKESVFSHDKDMMEYGLDSISLTQFFSELSEKFSLFLTPAVFYEHPTLNSLTEYLVDEFDEQLNSYFGVDSSQNQIAITQQKTEKLETLSSSELISSRFEESIVGYSLENNRAGTTNSEIAIVGVAGVMPQSDSLEEFWTNLVNKNDLVSEIPEERWDWQLYQANTVGEKNKTNSKWGGFIRGIEYFDPQVFGISAVEAELMDPQHRIFMEVVWKSIEDSGHCPGDLAGTKTGLFVGVGTSDYLDLLRESQSGVIAYTATGNTHSMLVNRISYLLDLRGSSEPIDTACSSSLVAIHHAVEAIARGDCDMAIAGGVNALLSPTLYISLGSAGVLADDGRCRSFDSEASGYVRGEGAGAIFLKKLDQAIDDGNPVYAVIKATGVNHGGRATSLTAPNPGAQSDLLVDVYTKANISPNSVGYIEAHGTGTALGDAVEVNALKNAFKQLALLRNETQNNQEYCGIGTVKTNIGHLETAAGIAGLLKVIYSLKHKTIPGNVHFNNLSPHIKLTESPFFVVKDSQEWKQLTDEKGEKIPRRAGISSFGFGGVNAHILIEEFPSVELAIETINEDKDVIIPLSARTSVQLKQQAKNLLAFIQQQAKPISLTSISYTLQVGRNEMERRLAIIANSIEQLTTKLIAYLDENNSEENIYQGSIDDNKEALELFSDDLPVLTEHWLSSGRYNKISEFWVKGISFDWRRMYPGKLPQRISLPTYPFAKEKYWIDSTGKSAEQKLKVNSNKLHPLLHFNSSDLSQQSFTSLFSGEELIFSTNQDNGNKIIKPLAYLEIVRAAIEFAVPRVHRDKNIELYNISWAKPFVLRSNQKLVTALFAKEDSQFSNALVDIDYEIYSERDGNNQVHNQGKILINNNQPPENIKLERLTEGASEYKNSTNEELSHVSGISFHEEQFFVQCKCDLSILQECPECVLHPEIMGLILNSCEFLIEKNYSSASVMSDSLFALESLRIISPIKLNEEFTIWLRPAQDNDSENVVKIDIDLFDKRGKVSVQLRSLSFLSPDKSANRLLREEWQFSIEKEPHNKLSSRQLKDSMQLFLKQNVANQIECEANQVDIQKNYFELGISSIGITNLVNQASQLVDDEISPGVIFEYPNIKLFSRFLIGNYGERLKGLVLNKVVSEENFSTSDKLTLAPLPRRNFEVSNDKLVLPEALRPDYLSSYEDNLIPIQPLGKKRPIFAMPGAGGSVLSLQPLSSELGNEQPFFGLQADTLENDISLQKSIEEIASENLKVIRKVQSEGPYQFVGYSNGGVVAYEMARQLMDNGEKVKSISLIDTVCPLARVNDVSEEIVKVCNNLIVTMGGQGKLDIDEIRKVEGTSLSDYLYSAMSEKGFSLSKEQFEHSFKIIMASDACCRDYKARPLPNETDVCLYRALDGYTDMPADYGWNQLLKKAISTVDINADHLSILYEDAIREIANNMNFKINGMGKVKSKKITS